MAKATYESLVSEAFLDPIRSVLIVDDDYPTLNEILSPRRDQDKLYKEKAWNQSDRNKARVKRVIEQFRRPDAPYMLDIHDGLTPSEETDETHVGSLQQTDLLILDYILDRAKADDGTASIRIAHEALVNKHFNLVLVHTNEDLDDIFGTFVLGLITPCFGALANEEQSAELSEFLGEHEPALLGSVGSAQYLAARRLYNQSSFDGLNAGIQKGDGALGQVQAALQAGGLNRTFWKEAVVHGLAFYESENETDFAKQEVGVLDWKDDKVKFIRASRGFICFTKKEKEKTKEPDLLEAVREALVAWRPLPSRLLLTKAAS